MPPIFGGQMHSYNWPTAYANISLKSHTHLGKLEKYKDSPKNYFQARFPHMNEESGSMDVQSFVVAEAGEWSPRDIV